MSKGALPCPFCDTGRAPEYKAYVPFYSAQYIAQFVIIPYEYVESVREIALHAQIKVSRHKNPKSPCVVKEELWTPKKLPLTDSREGKVNLMSFLVLRLWKDDELKQYAINISSQKTETKLEEKSAGSKLLREQVANQMFAQNGHHTRVTTDADGNLVPLAEVLPALGNYKKKNKPN